MDRGRLVVLAVTLRPHASYLIFNPLLPVRVSTRSPHISQYGFPILTFHTQKTGHVLMLRPSSPSPSTTSAGISQSTPSLPPATPHAAHSNPTPRAPPLLGGESGSQVFPTPVHDGLAYSKAPCEPRNPGVYSPPGRCLPQGTHHGGLYHTSSHVLLRRVPRGPALPHASTGLQDV